MFECLQYYRLFIVNYSLNKQNYRNFLIGIQEQIKRTMSTPGANDNQKHYKFMFQANVKTVSLALKFPCVVSVIWKRGQKAQQVKQRKPIEKGIITFNQTLEIQCNMVYDLKWKQFQQKKTKFTILIFSQKGNKQAGEVYLDVAQLLNTKNKSMQYEKPLEKCPDKNAKLKLELQCYMKEQITPDMISQRSQKTFDVEASVLNAKDASVVQPDFKKKKNEALQVDDKGKEEKVQSKGKPGKQPTSSNKSQQPHPTPTTPTLSKQNTSYLSLQQQYKRLKLQLQQLKDLQLQNQNLKRKYQQADKKAESYYKKKYQEMKEEYNQLKQKNQQIMQMVKKKEELQLVICECKETIGKIFNYAIMNGNDKLMEMMEQFD